MSKYTSHDTQIGNKSHLAQCPARNALLVHHRTKILEKRQSQARESRDHGRGKVKTDKSDIWIRNTNYI